MGSLEKKANAPIDLVRASDGDGNLEKSGRRTLEKDFGRRSGCQGCIIPTNEL